MVFELDDCQCPRCKNTPLLYEAADQIPSKEVLEQAVRCPACGESYDVIWGIPFLGVYGEDDLPGLIEIAANAENYSRQSKSRRSEWIDPWLDMLDEYHLSADRESIIRKYGLTPQDRIYLPTRYNEHIFFHLMTAGLDFGGKKVLDVGAGLGFDSCRFLRAGAQVTCFDYSPILSHQGLLNVPEARWIAGTAPVLPFKEDSFDVVIANAALHHIRDVPATIAEMLRVLKPGGVMLTISDSFRADHLDDDFLVSAFKDHEAVLMGVNEGIPRLRDFLSILQSHQDKLEVAVFTTAATTTSRPVPYPLQWTLKDARQHLSSGAIGLRVTLKETAATVQPQLPKEIIRPADYAHHLENQAEALARLAGLLPDHLVDLRLLDTHHAMFRLLNGWKPVEENSHERTAFSRARLFIRRKPSMDYVNITVYALYTEQFDSPEFAILVDGQEIQRVSLQRGLWTRLSAHLPSSEDDKVSAIEVRLLTPLTDMSARSFRVRHFALARQPDSATSTPADLVSPNLAALVSLGMMGDKSVKALFSDDYDLSIDTINRLRHLGCTIKALVVQGQESILGAEPEMTIIGSYAHPIFSPNQSGLAFDADIVIAPTPQDANRLEKRLPNRIAAHPRYAILRGGTADKLPILLPIPPKTPMKNSLILLRRIVHKIRRVVRR